MERKRIVVAFGDIMGFRTWTRRASNTPEITRELIDSVYSEFESIASSSGYYVKFLGDGIMFVRELGSGHNCGVIRKFILEMHDFCHRMQDILKKYWPRPTGFRIRVTSGHVWKRQVIKRRNKKIYKCPEFVGYAVNMAQGMLSIHAETLCICDESIVEILGDKKSGLIFELLKVVDDRRTGVDPEDLQGLRSFKRI